MPQAAPETANYSQKRRAKSAKQPKTPSRDRFSVFFQ
jgi:hypothetical protein